MFPRLELIFATTLLLVVFVNAQNSTEEPIYPTEDIMFNPESLLLKPEGTTHVVRWYTDLDGVHSVTLKASDEKVSSVSTSTLLTSSYANTTFEGSFNVSMHFLGFSDVNLTLLDDSGQVLASKVLETTVILKYQKLNQIFTVSTAVFVGLIYVNMGATLDAKVVKKIAKKPIGPALGVFCQYIVMPLIAFGLSQMVFHNETSYELGMFLSGTCPGGGASNMWTHLLGGSLDLSIMMTFTSTIVAFIAIPAWVLLVGPVIVSDGDFEVPFDQIVLLVVSLMLPCGVGIAIQKFLPKVAKILEKGITPFAIFNILYIMFFGLYANRFIFQILTVRIFFSTLALPVFGYLSGLILAILMRLPYKDAIAVSIETGVQNASIAIIILNLAIGPPAGTLGIVIPGMATILQPFPLLVVYIVKLIYDKIRGNKTPKEIEASLDVETKSAPYDVVEYTAEKDGIDNPVADLPDSPTTVDT